MILTATFEVGLGAVLISIFDGFMPSGGKNPAFEFIHRLIPQDDWYQRWAVTSLFLIGFTIGKSIFSYFSTYLMSKIGQLSILDLRNELYQHVIKQSETFFEKHRTNFLVSRLIVSCSSIEYAVSANLRDILRESFRLIAFLIFAFRISWKLSLGIFILGPIVGLLTARFSKAIKRFSQVSIDGNKEMTDLAQETLTNHTIVTAYNAQEREMGRFSKVAKVIAWANLRSAKIVAFSPAILETVGAIVIVALFFFGLLEINSGALSSAEFFGLLWAIFSSYDPMRKISRQHNELAKAFTATKDVWDVLDESDKLPEKENAVEIVGLKNAIELDSVSFAYSKNEELVVDDISLKIERGKTVALVGESGGGKSSITKLVQRLYDPTDGIITWDNQDLRNIDLASLRKQLALVTQETVLFNDTVYYNITYGKPDATLEQVKEAARIAYADEFIEKLPQKYDSPVGERGSNLSGGQRQRIAIARAALMNAPVIILDEATSALDAESERLVQKTLTSLMHQHTSIVIAHRLSTIRRADLIVVVENGRIIEKGTHDELIKLSGKYKLLYEIQFTD